MKDEVLKLREGTLRDGDEVLTVRNEVLTVRDGDEVLMMMGGINDEGSCIDGERRGINDGRRVINDERRV